MSSNFPFHQNKKETDSLHWLTKDPILIYYSFRIVTISAVTEAMVSVVHFCMMDAEEKKLAVYL